MLLLSLIVTCHSWTTVLKININLIERCHISINRIHTRQSFPLLISCQDFTFFFYLHFTNYHILGKDFQGMSASGFVRGVESLSSPNLAFFWAHYSLNYTLILLVLHQVISLAYKWKEYTN